MTQTETLSREASLEVLDKVFEKVKLELQAQQYLDERLNQKVESASREAEAAVEKDKSFSKFPNRLSTDAGVVHLFQRIEEESQNPLDDETIGWTVTNMEDGVLTLKNNPAWDRVKEIEPSELSKDRYTLKTTAEGLPRFAY